MSYNTLYGNVPSDWVVDTIENIAELKQGLQISSKLRLKEYEEGSIPLLKITDLHSRVFSEFVKDIPEQYIGGKEDIIYTRTGQVGLVYTNVEGCVHNNCFKIITNPNKFDKQYIYYYLNSEPIRQYSNAIASGSVQKDLTHKSFKKCIVAYPPLQEQKAIANILSSLDEKIELNNQMNKTLEEMAQALFKRWFVDFEFLNEDGQPYKSSGGEMVESELGMIPKEWEITTLNEVGDIVAGGTPSTKNQEYYDGDIPWITPRDLSGYTKKFIEKGERSITELGLQKSSAKLMPANSVLFSSRAPIGYVVISKGKVCTNQGFKSIVCNEEKVSYNYIYWLLKIQKEKIESVASGSTFKEVSGKTMKEYKIILPQRMLLNRFKDITDSFDGLIIKNEEELDRLQEIRDTLLPKLMSGEIRVTDLQN